jgi:hypothetical protein
MFLKIHKRKKDGQTSTQIWKDVIRFEEKVKTVDSIHFPRSAFVCSDLYDISSTSVEQITKRKKWIVRNRRHV